MRFYLDEDLPYKAAQFARRLGVDAITTAECERNGTSDEEQLAFAADVDRCIVTRNRGDFIGLTHRFIAEERSHSGVLLVPGSMGTDDYRGIAMAIARYEEQHPDGMPPYMVDYLIPVPR